MPPLFDDAPLALLFEPPHRGGGPHDNSGPNNMRRQTIGMTASRRGPNMGGGTGPARELPRELLPWPRGAGLPGPWAGGVLGPSGFHHRPGHAPAHALYHHAAGCAGVPGTNPAELLVGHPHMAGGTSSMHHHQHLYPNSAGGDHLLGSYQQEHVGGPRWSPAWGPGPPMGSPPISGGGPGSNAPFSSTEGTYNCSRSGPGSLPSPRGPFSVPSPRGPFSSSTCCPGGPAPPPPPPGEDLFPPPSTAATALQQYYLRVYQQLMTAEADQLYWTGGGGPPPGGGCGRSPHLREEGAGGGGGPPPPPPVTMLQQQRGSPYFFNAGQEKLGGLGDRRKNYGGGDRSQMIGGGGGGQAHHLLHRSPLLLNSNSADELPPGSQGQGQQNLKAAVKKRGGGAAGDTVLGGRGAGGMERTVGVRKARLGSFSC